MAASHKTFRPDADDTRAFREALGTFATGVTIVTCKSEVGPLGMTANSFASVSLDPPLVLWSPARASKRFPAFEAAEHFAIHILGEDQHDFCTTFASDGGDFSQLTWQESATGVPLIDGCAARFECQQYAVHDGGDHAIIVGQVISASIIKGQGTLIFSGGVFGHFTEMN